MDRTATFHSRHVMKTLTWFLKFIFIAYRLYILSRTYDFFVAIRPCCRNGQSELLCWWCLIHWWCPWTQSPSKWNTHMKSSTNINTYCHVITDFEALVTLRMYKCAMVTSNTSNWSSTVHTKCVGCRNLYRSSLRHSNLHLFFQKNFIINI